MTPWLTLVIGVILGLLFGWLLDLLWRRRSGAAKSADDVAAPARAVEWSLPRPTPAMEILAGPDTAAARATDVPAAPDMEDALAEDVLAPTESKAPDLELREAAVEVAAPAETELSVHELPEAPVEMMTQGEVERVNWPVLSDRVAQVADEVVDAPAHIRAELPETTEQLSSDALEALAPTPGEGSSTPAKDDFLRIEGIGRVYDGRLRAAGINTFAELVNVGEVRLLEIIQPQAWQRVGFAEWIEQARLIVEGNEEELRLLQGRLFSRKKG